MTIKDELDLLVALFAVLSTIYAGIKHGRKILGYLQDFAFLPIRIKNIESEIRTNGGSTLKDAINRIEYTNTVNKHMITSISEEIYQGTFEADTRGEFTRVSSGFSTLTGKSQQECLGANWVLTIHEKDRERVFEEWKTAVDNKRIFEMNFTMVRDNNLFEFPVRCRAVPMLNAKGTPIGWFGFIRKFNTIVD